MSVAPPGLPERRAWEAERRRASWRQRGSETKASSRLAAGIGASTVLHAAAIVALLLAPHAPRKAEPPVYRVDLVAAPPGPRSIGTVTPEPPAPTPPAATPPPKPVAAPPPKAETPPPKAKPLPTPVKEKPKPLPPKATPVPPTKANTAPKSAAKPKTPGPRAGGGPEGGQGADVANVHVRGLEFPFPGYLQNIVRQVALRFSPPNRAAVLQADISFLIHRDGSVSDVRIVKRSGSYGFDLEAQGAIESASSARAFGPLPGEFRDDVLPVTFSFDPRVIR